MVNVHAVADGMRSGARGTECIPGNYSEAEYRQRRREDFKFHQFVETPPPGARLMHPGVGFGAMRVRDPTTLVDNAIELETFLRGSSSYMRLERRNAGDAEATPLKISAWTPGNSLRQVPQAAPAACAAADAPWSLPAAREPGPPRIL